jgi:hypothetical protein
MTKQVCFEPSTVRRITVDFMGNILPIAHMYDRFANETFDPALATACVVELPSGWWSTTTDDIPIYTVH